MREGEKSGWSSAPPTVGVVVLLMVGGVSTKAVYGPQDSRQQAFPEVLYAD